MAAAEEAGAKEADYDPIADDEEEYALPAEAGVGDYLLHPFKTFEAYLQRFFNNFGWRFAVQMSVMYMLVKGVMHATIYMTQLPFCKKFALDEPEQ